MRWLIGILLALTVLLSGCRDEPAPGAPDTSAFLRNGLARFHEARYREALSWADSLLLREDPDGLFLQGLIYTELGDTARAGSAYRAVLSRNAHYAGVHLNLAILSLATGDPGQALRHLTQEEDGRSLPAYYVTLARALRAAAQPDSAVAVLDSAMALRPVPALVYKEQALRYLRLARHDAAAAFARRALEQDSSDFYARYLLASALNGTGKYDEARRLLQRITTAVPWHYPSWEALSDVWWALDYPGNSRQADQRAVTLRRMAEQADSLKWLIYGHPGQPSLHAARGLLLRRMGNAPEAVRAYRAALFYQPADLTFRNNLAVALLAAGDTTGAVHTLKSIVAVDPSQAGVWTNMGVLYARTGKRKEARQAFTKALQLNPKDKKVRGYLDRLPR